MKSFLKQTRQLSLILVIIVSMILPSNALAASFTAGTFAELVTAINTANGNSLADEITLTADITLTGILPQIASDITIEGAGFTLDGDNSYRVLYILSGTVALNNITLTKGRSIDSNIDFGNGGGIYNRGTLTLNNSTLSGNTVTEDGGGIFNNNGTLTLNNSTISGNTATGEGWQGTGGGIGNTGVLTLNNSTVGNNSANNSGGGIYNMVTLILNNSTISGNSANANGGGIYNSGQFGSNAILNLNYSTITNNTGDGGGIYNTVDPWGSTTSASFSNSIVAGNNDNSTPANNDCGNDGVTTPLSLGYNIIGNNDGCSIADGTGDNFGTTAIPVNANLAALADNGGETKTHALNTGSPALNQIPDGTNGCGSIYTTDQRGVARPYPAGGSCDIGAYEFDDTAPTVTINQGVSQSDPTNASPIVFDVVFSENVTGFDSTDVQISGTAGSPTIVVTSTGSGDTYTVSVSDMADGETITATIPANAAQNLAGNDSEASTSTDNSVTYDTASPTVTIEQGASQSDPTNASPIIFDVVFSENVSGFDETDVNIAGMAGAPSITVISTGTGDTYTVEVTGMADGETVTATIPANAAQDATGNNSEASTSTDNSVTYNTSVPIVLFDANTVPANGASLTTGPTQIKIEFSESVTKISAQDTANYLLVEAGANDTFDTTSCAVPGGDTAAPNDLKISVDTATYDDSDPFITTLDINGGTPLPAGNYRLFICGTTSIENAAGTHLNDGLTDSLLNFTVQASSSGDGDGSGATTLPKTGFPRGHITSLPEQPAAKAYTETAMMLDIPKLGVSMPIVGVPQSESGWDVNWLGNSAGYLAGSAFPTWAGNTVITAHVWDSFNRPGAFAELKSLGYGDQVQIHAWGLTYTYEVRDSKLVTTKNVSAVLQSEEYDWVTLVTCEFYTSRETISLEEL